MVATRDIRVVVCDDHALFRRGVVIELDETDDLEVVAEATNGQEAVEVATRLAPDVILMDVRMPGMDGIEATRRLTELIPASRILMLTVSDEGDDLFEAVKAGAAGYLLKESSLAAVGDAIRAVAAGQSFVSPAMAARLLGEFRLLADRTSAHGGTRSDHVPLTNREVGVLEAMADGADNTQIASRLDMTEKSVTNHVRNVLDKLHLQTRTEAVLYAVRERLIDP